MACGNEYYLGDLLMAAGFPNIEITSSNRLMAYECVLVHEVVSKRIIVLEDLRKGLQAERSMGLGILDLARRHEEIRTLLFPKTDTEIDVQDLMKLVVFDAADTCDNAAAKGHLEKYFHLLAERGTYNSINLIQDDERKVYMCN